MFVKSVIVLLAIIIRGIRLKQILEYHSPFPVKSNSTFQLILSEAEDHSPYSVLRLEILNNDNVLSRTFIYPGLEDRLEMKISNQYFWIENWFKDSYKRINLLVRLLEPANNKWICVSYLNTKSLIEKNAAVNEPCTKKALLHVQIVLIVDPVLELTVTTKDGRTDGVHQNDIATITCVSSKGAPQFPPQLYHPSSLLVKSRRYIIESNTYLIYFLASISDNGKIVGCSAGQSYVSSVIRVFHNPSAVHLSPAYSSYLSNGSSVQCISSNGHPKPTVSWIFINGPPNASKYYLISPSYNLTMLPDAPIGTVWTFNCSSINSIAASYDSGTMRSFTFVIYPIKLATTVIVALVICVSLLLVILVAICCNRRKLHDRIMSCINSLSKNSRNAGDEALNNFTSSYFTYPVVTEPALDNGIDDDIKKKPKKSRRDKTKCDMDLGYEDTVV